MPNWHGRALVIRDAVRINERNVNNYALEIVLMYDPPMPEGYRNKN